MRGTYILFGATLSIAALAACTPAPTAAEMEAKLRSATVEALPGTDPTTVTISDQVAAPARMSWKASITGKVYMCDADEQVRLPQCVLAT
jgi:hypothetical protein